MTSWLPYAIGVVTGLVLLPIFAARLFRAARHKRIRRFFMAGESQSDSPDIDFQEPVSFAFEVLVTLAAVGGSILMIYLSIEGLMA